MTSLDDDGEKHPLWVRLAVQGFLILCLRSILAGIGMALWTGEAAWLALCAPLILFLS